MNSPRICITGKSNSQLLVEIESIKSYYHNMNEIRVSLKESLYDQDFDYIYSDIKTLEKDILNNDLVGFINRNFNIKEKTIKTDGNCNLQVVDDPAKHTEHKHDKKVKRNSNYTPPKKRNKKKTK